MVCVLGMMYSHGRDLLKMEGMRDDDTRFDPTLVTFSF